MATTIDSKITYDHPSVKTVHCGGNPYQIGFIHGQAVSTGIHHNIRTYTSFFAETVQITWGQARERAVAEFTDTLQEKYPEILEEMKGIADGAGAGLTAADILTLNVRSEIALTNYADGCTSISQKAEDGRVFVAQNWDWLEELQQGLVFLHIKPEGSAVEMKFLSEAGIVGKIGMNNAGFGLCSNALRSGAYNQNSFPIHVMSRRLLQYATSVSSALSIIDEFGTASTSNYMLADKSGSHLDIECSPYGNVVILPRDNSVAHTNHLYGPNRPARLVDHPAPNSMTRLARIQELIKKDLENSVPTTFESIRTRFADQEGFPYSICRSRPAGAIGMERMITLSTIMMDMTSCTGRVLIGKPCDELPIVEWSF
ncbi:acyl-coenzyme A:6-aminopenicillanic-acid-acyltransferase [Talaromyces proteolyticus]|uniref:Acyl-coenzyme A:6-aminopenicillanic-acid-acyltransferase n=1 Tax=Talaromyces proteolyticus TaxID=1131652 RepID=A0AAD4KYD2_9EURO|nr:acyl-coenzyme A:6-aminopenicillanic-acid-acyltransferase [Talaromyces proteolyticus]KAH8701807.1 acyl-coenzyme A:6-aminopenicillanic-acid-acyltransferase [Talaromyces proteolyticus]